MLLSSGTMLVDDSLRSQASDFSRRAHDRSVSALSVRLDDGAEIELPADLAGFIGSVLECLTQGAVSITSLPDELTTTMAAEMLGVTRPTLMKWVAAGELPAHKVGTHTRLNTADVLQFRSTVMSRRRDAFDALRAWDDAAG